MPLQFPTIDTRLTARERPLGPPLMQQTWEHTLFLHWIAPHEAVQALLPEPLTLDTHDNRAWMGIVPVRNRDVRPGPMPPLPWPMEYEQVNVRTYVHYEGVPGIWFFSMDANSEIAVKAARAAFHLPYVSAEVKLTEEAGLVHYRSRRTEGDVPATFDVKCAVGDLLPGSDPDSLEFFLTERYWLFVTDDDGRLIRCRVHHEPWRLRATRLEHYRSTLLRRAGLPDSTDNPMLLAANPVHAEIWPLERL